MPLRYRACSAAGDPNATTAVLHLTFNLVIWDQSNSIHTCKVSWTFFLQQWMHFFPSCNKLMKNIYNTSACSGSIAFLNDINDGQSIVRKSWYFLSSTQSFFWSSLWSVLEKSSNCIRTGCTNVRVSVSFSKYSLCFTLENCCFQLLRSRICCRQLCRVKLQPIQWTKLLLIHTYRKLINRFNKRQHGFNRFFSE